MNQLILCVYTDKAYANSCLKDLAAQFDQRQLFVLWQTTSDGEKLGYSEKYLIDNGKTLWMSGAVSKLLHLRPDEVRTHLEEALKDIGFVLHKASQYADFVCRGSVLIGVVTSIEDEQIVRDIIRKHQPQEFASLSVEKRYFPLPTV